MRAFDFEVWLKLREKDCYILLSVKSVAVANQTSWVSGCVSSFYNDSGPNDVGAPFQDFQVRVDDQENHSKREHRARLTPTVTSLNDRAHSTLTVKQPSEIGEVSVTDRLWQVAR